MEKNIKLDKGTVRVYLKLSPWKPGVQKVRYYEHQAREWVKEKYPKTVLGRTIKPCVVRNQGPVTEGEWIFEVVQEKKPAPKVAKKVTKKISTKKKEVVDVKNSDGAS